jgi:hypothetical protein
VANVKHESLWHRALVPIVLIVAALIVGYAFNFFIGAALVVIALAILVSRLFQHAGPPETGE